MPCPQAPPNPTVEYLLGGESRSAVRGRVSAFRSKQGTNEQIKPVAHAANECTRESPRLCGRLRWLQAPFACHAPDHSKDRSDREATTESRSRPGRFCFFPYAAFARHHRSRTQGVLRQTNARPRHACHPDILGPPLLALLLPPPLVGHLRPQRRKVPRLPPAPSPPPHFLD